MPEKNWSHAPLVIAGYIPIIASYIFLKMILGSYPHVWLVIPQLSSPVVPQGTPSSELHRNENRRQRNAGGKGARD